MYDKKSPPTLIDRPGVVVGAFCRPLGSVIACRGQGEALSGVAPRHYSLLGKVGKVPLRGGKGRVWDIR